LLWRFIQHAIWRYCSQSGLDVCNGNRINDAKRCGNMDCRVRGMCDCVVLRNDHALARTGCSSAIGSINNLG
jgi:hypothetical protein